MAGALGSLPSTQRILGNIGSGGQRARRSPQSGQQPNGPQDGAHQGHADPQTFAQLQQQGLARPAPPQAYGPPQTTPLGQAPPSQHAPPSAHTPIQSQLEGVVSHALTTPSRYDTPTFNTLRDSATADLTNQYGKIRQATEENLARRGLAASTFGANDLHDVDAAQSRDLATLNSQLLQQAATTQASDRQAAISGGTTYLQQQLAQQLGLGNLGIAQQQANTQQAGTLGQLGLGQQQLAQQGSQFGQSLGEQSRQFNVEQQLAQLLGVGNLGVAQQQADTSRAGTLGQLGLGQQQLAQQGQQFGQTFGLSQLQNQQQYGLQTQAQDLARTLGLGNLGLQQQQVANQASQFGQTFGLQQQAQTAQQQQFQQQLAQALGLATMSDQTANRGIDANAALANSDLMLRVASLLGISNLPSSAGGGGSSSGGGYTGPSPWDTGDRGGPITDGGDDGRSSGAHGNFIPIDSASFDAASGTSGTTDGTLKFANQTFSPDAFTRFAQEMTQAAKNGSVQLGGRTYTASQLQQALTSTWNNYAAAQLTRQNAATNARDSGPAATPDGRQANGMTLPSGYATGQWNDRMPTFDDMLEMMRRNGATPDAIARLNTPQTRHMWDLSHTGDGSGQAEEVARNNAAGAETRALQARRLVARKAAIAALVQQGYSPDEITDDMIEPYL